MPEITPKKVVITSLAVDIFDIALNSIVAIFTGSSVMLAEALQGVTDLVTVIFLYIGIKRSARRPNVNFNFGYGRELFFWVLCSAIAMLILTAGISFYAGLGKLLNPEPLERTVWAYVVLSIGILTNLYALSVSVRKLQSTPKKASVVKNFTQSHLIEVKTALVTDLMGSFAATFGLAALVLYGLTGDARYDGIGAMIIAVIVAVFAIYLIKEAEGMIVGRSATEKTRQQIREIVAAAPQVRQVTKILTMHFGSEELYLNINIKVDDKLTANEVCRATDNIEADIKKAFPQVDIIQIELDT